MKTNDKLAQTLVLLIAFVLLVVCKNEIDKNQKFVKPALQLNMQSTKYNLKPEFYNIVNLGQKRLFSSLLWIDTLLNTDHEHYKNKDLLNWMFLRFDTITNLDKFFYEAYRYGGAILSVIKDDDLGALKIYDKGLSIFSNDVNLLFYAGIHAYFELQDDRLAIQYLEKIKDTENTPAYLPSLISKLKASSGDIRGGYQLLLTAYENTPASSPIKSHFHKSLYSLKSEIDLICLNNGNENCDKQDFDGNYYLLGIDGKYYATKGWTKVRPLGARKK